LGYLGVFDGEPALFRAWVGGSDLANLQRRAA